MRSVRTKLILLVLVCLVPTLVTTLVLSALLDRAQRADALARIGAAESAFTTELRDDIADVDVAARLLANDPDVVREVAARDRALLGQHIRDFTLVYPAMRVVLMAPGGEILASTDAALSRGHLTLPPPSTELGGVQRLIHPDGTSDTAYSYEVVRSLLDGQAVVGLALASFPLDAEYLDNTRAKAGMELALRRGRVIEARTSTASSAEPVLAEDLVAGARQLRTVPGGRTLAVTAFAPPQLAPLEVVAAVDFTPAAQALAQTHLRRMLSLGGVALVALALALWLSRGMGRAVGALAAVLPGIAEGRYERVDDVHTRDELEDLARVYNHLVDRMRDHQRWRTALGRYLSPAAQEAVERGDVHLGGSCVSATVLFSDIRGFTTLAEGLPPERVLDLLNRYFTEMVAAVNAHGGTVDKYVGDCIMAVWGAPHSLPGDALSAVRAGLAMRARLAELNRRFAQDGLPELKTGIGLHTGTVVAGNIGAEDAHGGRMEYTVIGDNVNLASRLEALTKELHVDFIISESTYAEVRDQVRVEPLSEVTVRGRTQPVRIYSVVGLVEDLVAPDTVPAQLA